MAVMGGRSYSAAGIVSHGRYLCTPGSRPEKMPKDHSYTRTARTQVTRPATGDHQQTILFDGVCNLCNGFVQFVIKHDRADRFRFGALQSDAAKQLLGGRELDPADLSTVLYLKGDRLLVRSSAALHIFKDLGGVWALAFVFMLVPRFLRDMVYNWVARNRYRWFGQRESCMLPTPELRAKFLDGLEVSPTSAVSAVRV